MIKRTLPTGYNSSEGRLVFYSTRFESAEETQQDVWQFVLEKQYAPWETWASFCRSYGLESWLTERPSVEEVTAQLQRDEDAMRDVWAFPAYQRAFHLLPNAAVAMLEDLLPFLNDPNAYNWNHLKSVLVSYVQNAYVDYPRLADPAYFMEHREEALALWGLLHGVSQVMGAKWELAWGACARDPDPNEISVSRFQPYDTIGWYITYFGNEFQVDEQSIDAFIRANERTFIPFQQIRTMEDFTDVYRDAAEVVFGSVWEAKYGHPALLADLERTLATPEEILRLHWLRHLRLGA